MRSAIRVGSFTGALGALALAGCSMAPRYERPAAPVAAGFPAAGPAGEAGPPAAPAAAPGAAIAASDLGWREVFGDARLRALVGLALAQNRDLRVATLNVELTRAQYRIQRAQQVPQLGASGVFTRQRTPAELSTSGAAVVSDAWVVGLGVPAFELDLFGRVKSLSDSALEQYLATEEARRSAQLSLVAAVASQYLTGLALEEQVALARETLAAVEASRRLTQRGAEAGRVSELDLRTADAQVEAARFNLALTQQLRAKAENGLVLLVGGPLPADLPPASPLDASQLVAELPAGVPSEVLVRRPDVQAAEHALQSANATIGAARAAFFPSISLTAFGGSASANLDGLLGAGSASWNFVPTIKIPIFAGGALLAGLDVAKVRTSMEVARYERTIQGAFREVADALVARAWLEEQLRAQAARVAADERRYQLSDRRYRAGIDAYVTVLTAQRDLFTSQVLLIQTRLASLTNLVDLYKALGGGWRETGEAGAATATATGSGG